MKVLKSDLARALASDPFTARQINDAIGKERAVITTRDGRKIVMERVAPVAPSLSDLLDKPSSKQKEK